MRDLKFRAWDGDEMVSDEKYGILFRPGQDPQPYVLDCDYGESGLLKFPPKLIIMQFTGLQDCNDKDIYEGDIVMYRGEKLLVTFRCGCWCLYKNQVAKLEYLNPQLKGYLHGGKMANIEVIGDTYRNPDLFIYT